MIRLSCSSAALVEVNRYNRYSIQLQVKYKHTRTSLQFAFVSKVAVAREFESVVVIYECESKDNARDVHIEIEMERYRIQNGAEQIRMPNKFCKYLQC